MPLRHENSTVTEQIPADRPDTACWGLRFPVVKDWRRVRPNQRGIFRYRKLSSVAAVVIWMQETGECCGGYMKVLGLN